jgi:hypothetical protein
VIRIVATGVLAEAVERREQESTSKRQQEHERRRHRGDRNRAAPPLTGLIQ